MRSPKLKNISIYCLLLVLITMVAGMGEVKGQYTKIRATYIGPYPANTGGTDGAGGAAGLFGVDGPIGTHTISTPANLNDNDYSSNYATLAAASGGLGTNLGGGAGLLSTAYLNLNFSTSPNSRNPIFIKATGLSSSRSNPYEQITVQPYQGASTVGSAVALSTLPINSAGYYILTPTATCNSIRIILTTDNGTSVLGLLGGRSTASVDIYDVYTLDPTCGPPTYTTAAVTGISLGGAVISQDNAIDGDLDTKSTLSVGLLSLLATIKQTVYFSKVSNPGDAATITFSVPAAVLNLGLFNGITLQAYNGTTAVGIPIQISSLLSLDLLGLLGNGTRFTGSYVPSVTTGFDRIEISTSAVASLLQNFYVHEVQQTPPKPTFIIAGSASSATICSGTSVILKADAPGSGNELRWYTAQTGGTLLITANSYTPSPSLTTTTTYYVATAKTGCAAESERVPVTVTVNPLPTATISGSTSVCQSATSPNITFTGASGTAPYTFTYNINGGSNTTIQTAVGNSITLAVPTGASGTFNYNLVSVKDNSSTQCTNTQSGTATVIVNPKPPHPIANISSN